MTSVIIPGLDLVPSLPSRVVTVDLVDMTEGAAVAGAKIDFFLPGDLHVPADDKILQAGRVTLTLNASGHGEIRLPAYTDAVKPTDWVIGVKKHWAPHPYYIRVPQGSTKISLADIPAVQALPQGVVDWMITGASATVTEGAQWDATLNLTGGILHLGLTVPPGGEAWSKGMPPAGTDLDMVTTPGVYNVWNTVTNRPVNALGTLEVTPIGPAGGVMQRYTAWSSTGEFRTWTRATNAGAWLPWRPDTWLSGLTTQNPNTVTVPGTYRYAATFAELPVNRIGILEVMPMSTTVIQRFTTWEPVPRVYVRTQPSAGNWDAWQEIGTSAGPVHEGDRSGRGVTVKDRALAVLDAYLPQAKQIPVPIVFVGSSTTAGAGASTTAHRYVNLVVAALQTQYPNGGTESAVAASSSATFTAVTTPGVHGYNAGEGGTTSANYLTGKISRIANLSPAAVIHMIGSNDYAASMPVATYKENIETQISAIDAAVESPVVHVLVHSFQRWDVSSAPGWAAYGAALREIGEARSSRVAVIDLSDAFALVGVPSSDPLGLILPDKVHATDAGNRVLAQAVLTGLGKGRLNG